MSNLRNYRQVIIARWLLSFSHDNRLGKTNDAFQELADVTEEQWTALALAKNRAELDKLWPDCLNLDDLMKDCLGLVCFNCSFDDNLPSVDDMDHDINDEANGEYFESWYELIIQTGIEPL